MIVESATATPSTAYYVAADKIYPRDVSGRHARLRITASIVLLGLFYVLPWIKWNDRQAVLFDLPARKFYVFGLVMWPQDFIYLTGLLVAAAFSLFFFTALGGRLWCGYACPQTVWTEVFLWWERLCEGDRSARMRLDRAPWSACKLARKSAKQGGWVLLSLWTGVTFVGFFTPIGDLLHDVRTHSAGGWETFWALFYGFATWGNAGHLREQVCKYMCPYARFQSAMFDRDTLVITYDMARGEPRGPRRRGARVAPGTAGACVDCSWCVQVCPTGIDIRDGLQYECIACAACIDACDAVMDKTGQPRGLIRYTTQNSLDGLRTRILRPRIVVYGALLALLAAALAVALIRRAPIGIEVLRDRNVMYRVLQDGRIENVYHLKLLNKTEQAHELDIRVRGAGDLQVGTGAWRTRVASGEVASVVVGVRAALGSEGGSRKVSFVVHSLDDPSLQAAHEARFLVPGQVLQ